uniref:EF-hand domain-containing protein n=1 Tax=Oryza barthii TaxID=65489 RepID=A0A0D3EPC4_9ORYZ
MSTQLMAASLLVSVNNVVSYWGDNGETKKGNDLMIRLLRLRASPNERQPRQAACSSTTTHSDSTARARHERAGHHHPHPTPTGDHDAAATACKPAETTTALITCRSSSCSAQQQQQQEEPLGDDQLGELREIFRSFDRNGDGSLTQLELGSLLRSLGLKPSTDELDSLIQRADTNSNGLIEFSEFVALVAPELLYDRAPYSEDQIRRLFNIFDRDGNGFITAAELAHSMAKLGHALTVKELTGMIKEADTDGDGRISFQEFSRAITAAAFDNIFS